MDHFSQMVARWADETNGKVHVVPAPVYDVQFITMHMDNGADPLSPTYDEWSYVDYTSPEIKHAWQQKDGTTCLCLHGIVEHRKPKEVSKSLRELGFFDWRQRRWRRAEELRRRRADARREKIADQTRHRPSVNTARAFGPDGEVHVPEEVLGQTYKTLPKGECLLILSVSGTMRHEPSVEVEQQPADLTREMRESANHWLSQWGFEI